MDGLVFLALEFTGALAGLDRGLQCGLGLLALVGIQLQLAVTQTHGQTRAEQRGRQGQHGQEAPGQWDEVHATTWMPSCAPALVMVMTRFTARSGTTVDTCTQVLPLTPSRMSWPMPSTSINGASALAIWYGVP